MKIRILTFIAAFWFPSAFAADGQANANGMLQTCGKEIQKFGCEATSESYAYDCLNQHRESRSRNKGFSARCFKSYASYEKENGRSEKIDSHQVEQPEHAR